MEHKPIERRPSSRRPLRHECRRTPAGLALAPIFVALQDWGGSWLLGDGSVTGLDSIAAALRVSALVGTKVPVIELPSTETDGQPEDVVAQGASATVLFGYTLATLGPRPHGFASVPGALGCTLENRLFRGAHPGFVDAGAAVRGSALSRRTTRRLFQTMRAYRSRSSPTPS